MVYSLPVRAANKPWGKGSSLPEYKVSPGRVRRLLASRSEGSQFPVSFLLVRCCHLHSHWVPPSHANNPMAINRTVHERQRKERNMLTPSRFMSWCLKASWGAGMEPCFPGGDTRFWAAPCTEPAGTPLCMHKTSSFAESLVLLAQFIQRVIPRRVPPVLLRGGTPCVKILWTL